MPLYLGIDCGTQGMDAVAIEIEGDRRTLLLECSLDYDDAFPGYGTRHGVYAGEEPGVVTSSPTLWADALDAVLGEVAKRLGSDLARVAAVAASGQQHGSVWLRAGLDPRLATLDPDRPLAVQLEGAFSVERSPVWMDTSTGAQCAAITDAVGGSRALARYTGSRAFERFTGPQIRKVFERHPDAYRATHRVHLVSSWVSTLLLGRHAPLDHGDGAGMNLMHLGAGDWWEPALRATAPGLRARLPRLVPSATVVGTLARYWRGRHGYPGARVVAGTGDNPSTLAGLGVVEPGVAAVSLGTSDTVFALQREPSADPAGAAHVFGAPTGDYMALVCFRNGSLARERVRDRFGLDWDGFSEALRSTPPGNGGALMLPWFEAEITPPVEHAEVRTRSLANDDAAAWVRACVEGQMLAMRRHSAWAAPAVACLHAAGGAAKNPEILQVMADVFGAPVRRLDVANAACLGAALRAAHGDLAAYSPTAGADSGPYDTGASWAEVLRGFGPSHATAAIRPRDDAARVYARMAERHAELETAALEASAGRASALDG